ncbi:hypothetical protein M422DRAFT_49466 [Sphaerobolus stellatus SS14]|uniref:Uncharacterized protein n=1 Tax=Sphaerobolus stellatus (strain SS14) TaxID=990650 RepID=A0A0C9VF20_SPHS4|nr:hypothetical protein M422DRAFT_49466 [Sphaerobolus stellatus SS14]
MAKNKKAKFATGHLRRTTEDRDKDKDVLPAVVASKKTSTYDNAIKKLEQKKLPPAPDGTAIRVGVKTRSQKWQERKTVKFNDFRDPGGFQFGLPLPAGVPTESSEHVLEEDKAESSTSENEEDDEIEGDFKYAEEELEEIDEDNEGYNITSTTHRSDREESVSFSESPSLDGDSTPMKTATLASEAVMDHSVSGSGIRGHVEADPDDIMSVDNLEHFQTPPDSSTMAQVAFEIRQMDTDAAGTLILADVLITLMNGTSVSCRLSEAVICLGEMHTPLKNDRIHFYCDWDDHWLPLGRLTGADGVECLQKLGRADHYEFKNKTSTGTPLGVLYIADAEEDVCIEISFKNT